MSPVTIKTPRLPSSRRLFTSIAASQESFSTNQLLSPFVCAIAADSGAWCWGRFPLSIETLWAPVLVPGNRRYIAISAGGAHACGLDAMGAIVCWSGVTSEPVIISGSRDFSGLAMSVNTTCGLSGTIVWCWVSGSLTLVTPIQNPTAIDAAGSQGFVSISGGPSMTCGVTTTADIWCWSQSLIGERVADGPFTFVSVGKDAACALDFYGHAYCWGANPYNWLGLEDSTSAIVTTASAVRSSLTFSSLSVGTAPGASHVCGVLRGGGQLVCWGATTFGRTGTGLPVGILTLPTEVNSSAMQPRRSSPITAYAVSTGASFTCALFNDAGVGAGAAGSGTAEWECLDRGWQHTWDGTTCVRAPDCSTQGTDVSWDGTSCAIDFSPASCNSNDLNYDPLNLSCGKAGALTPPETLGNWVNRLPFIILGSGSIAEMAAALPARNTPLGSALVVNTISGAIIVYMAVALLGMPLASEFDEAARAAFERAVVAALVAMGVQGNVINTLIFITDVRDFTTQVDDGTAKAAARMRMVQLGNSVVVTRPRRATLVDTPALAIEFYISTHDAFVALQAVALAAFATGYSDTVATQAGITTSSAAYLGAAFTSTLTDALQASSSTTFAACSILSLTTMPAAVPAPSPTPSTAAIISMTAGSGEPLGKGAIAGIAIASLAVAIIVIVVAMWKRTAGKAIRAANAEIMRFGVSGANDYPPAFAIHHTSETAVTTMNSPSPTTVIDIYAISPTNMIGVFTGSSSSPQSVSVSPCGLYTPLDSLDSYYLNAAGITRPTFVAASIGSSARSSPSTARTAVTMNSTPSRPNRLPFQTPWPSSPTVGGVAGQLRGLADGQIYGRV